jgi:hypothetical protein
MATKEVKQKGSSKKIPSKNSGRSCSSENPNGVRRKSGGQELAPRSLRAKGKKLLSDCSESELEAIGLK